MHWFYYNTTKTIDLDEVLGKIEREESQMEKLSALLLALCLLGSNVTGCLAVNHENPALSRERVNLNEISDNSSEMTVLEIMGENLAVLEIADNIDDKMIDYLNDGGIILINTEEATSSLPLDKIIDVPVVESIAEETSENTNIGIDIATLYYKSNGTINTNEINVDSDDSSLHEELINKAIDEISVRQLKEGVNSSRSSSTGKDLGDRTYTYVREKKGILKVTYSFSTVQNRNRKDYYLVKANVNGRPGSELGDNYGNYDGEELMVSISGTQTGVALDEYGPVRTNKDNSYSVNLGVNLGKLTSLGLSYTGQLLDTTLDVSTGNRSVDWDVSMSSEADKSTCTFKPGAVFTCPENRANVELETEASYVLDSLFTARDTISIEKTFTCSSNSLEV